MCEDEYLTGSQMTAKDLFACTIFLGIVCWCVNYLWNLRILSKSVENIPGPRPWPLIGNAHLFMGSDCDLATQILRLSVNYPDLGRGWLGPNKLIFFVTKPEYIEVILNSPNALDKSDSYRFVKFFLGNGLGTVKAEEWRKNRKILQPTFKKKIIDGHLDEINKHSAMFVKILREKCQNGNEIDVEKYVMNFAIDAFVSTILGISETSAQQSDNGIDCAALLEKISEATFTRMCKFWLHFEPIYRCTNLYEEQKECKQQLKVMMDKLIMQVKDKIQADLVRKPDFYKPFPDEILRNNPKCAMSEQQFQDEFYTFFVAGSDTNSKTLSFIFLMLALNPQVQEQLFKEVTQVLGNRTITLDDLNHFQYTECVIKETLRLIPVFPIMGRNTTGPIDLGNSLVIPRDSQLFIIVQNVQKRSDYWENPMEFRPERFMQENMDQKRHHPYAWLPFSGGPRNCIGMKFAMMLLKIAVANVIREFKIESRDYSRFEQVEFVINLTMKCKKTLRLYFEARI